MKRLLCLTFIMILSASFLKGQTYQGKIIDEKQNPVEFANIVFLSLPDSSFVEGTISNSDGSFSAQVTGENMLIRISSVGYKTIYKSVHQTDIDIIQLNSDTQQLGEVVIKGDLPKTRVKGDVMITGVEGTILEKSGTAENLLDKIPNVSSKNGNIEVFGRGAAEIYINGRKVRNKSELDQLAADNIKSVEVNNNPGARYDASVKAVIRIRTKKAQGEGFGFNNRAYASYNKKWTFLDQFNFNYRYKGFDLQGMIYGLDGNTWENKQVIQDTYLDKHWMEVSDIKGKNHYQRVNSMLALNYTFNDKHALGIRYDYARTPKEHNTVDMPMFLYQDNELTEDAIVSALSHMQETRHNMNVYYSGNVGKWNIDFNADGLWSNSDQSDRSDETTNYPDGREVFRQVNTLNDVENELYAAKLILSYPLFEGNLSFGGEYAHTGRTNDYRNPEGILDNNKNEIKEGSIAGFIEYSRTFGPINVQAGLRLENVTFNYYENSKKMEEQSKKYNNLFPSLSVSAPIGKVQMLLSYASDITRPSYHQLRGNIVYNDRYTYESGNPLLQPSLSQNVTLTASYKWLQLSAGYQHIKDAIVFTCDAYSEKDPAISLISLKNAPAYDNIFASFVLSPTVGFWSPQLSLQMQKQWYTAETPQGTRGLNGPIGIVSMNNGFELPAGFQLNVDGSWTTCGYSENQQLTNNRWGIDASLYKGFFNDRLSLLLRGNDLFNTMRTKAIIYYGAVRTLTTNIEPSSRSISLTIRYKFNATKSKYKGTGAGQEQRARM